MRSVQNQRLGWAGLAAFCARASRSGAPAARISVSSPSLQQPGRQPKLSASFSAQAVCRPFLQLILHLQPDSGQHGPDPLPTRPANDAISWQHRDTWPPAAFSSSSIASPCILRDISRVPASPPRGQRCRDRLAPVSDLQRPSPPIPCVDPCPARTAAMSAALCRSLLEVLTEPS